MSAQSTRQLKTKMQNAMFENIEEASSFWIQLWKSQGMGNRKAQWLKDIRSEIYSRVPPPSEKPWKLDTMEATQVLARKKNWSAPGTDRLTNFGVKRQKCFMRGALCCFKPSRIPTLSVQSGSLKAKPHSLRNPENLPAITRDQSPV